MARGSDRRSGEANSRSHERNAASQNDGQGLTFDTLLIRLKHF